MEIIKYVSPFVAIRTAMGDLGMSGLMQTIEEDLVRWAIEAQELIGKDESLIMKSGKFRVKNNMVRYCADMSIIDCVSVDKVDYDYKRQHDCYVTKSCKCNNNDRYFTADGCNISFEPMLEDGKEVEIKYLARKLDENGYPMIADIAVIAIQEYIKWKLCVRYRDNRSAESQRRWYELCMQIRAKFNKVTNEQAKQIGNLYIAKRRNT